jgi:hypothetical protein
MLNPPPAVAGTPRTPRALPISIAQNGHVTSPTAMSVMVATSGLATKMLKDPWLISMDWRNASSALSPSTRASTSGAIGIVELLEDVADDAENQGEPEIGLRRADRPGADEAHDDDDRADDREGDAQDRGEERHRGEHQDHATTLPRYIEAISPQTKSGRSMNSMGRG